MSSSIKNGYSEMLLYLKICQKKNLTQYFVLSVDTENLYEEANETNVLYCNNNRQKS